MVVHLMSMSACIDAVFTERIFVKCDTGKRKSVGKLEIWLTLDIYVGRFTEDLILFMFLTKYFVARKDYEENPLLRFHDKIQRFFLLLTVTSKSTKAQCPSIVMFSWR